MLMYAGAGSAPMLAAATAWDGLAAELGSAAQSFSSVTSGLAGEAWQGTASTAMLSTAAQYTGVLSAAATQAQSAAAQAQTIAGAFESAVVATVHPALVSANRNGLVQLVVSNLFGQNAPTIAAAESDYEQMWARDVAAMVDYHGGVSAAASQLTSWSAAVRGLPAQASGAITATPVGAALNSLNPAASNPLATVEQYAIAAINGPTEFLFGRPLISIGPAVGLGGTVSSGTATAPLTLCGGAEPLVNASVGGGAPVPLLVDTGSTGLVIPFQNAGGLLGTLQLGLPTGFGVGGYSGGINYLYATYNAPVNFGGGLVTSRTPVDIELFAWPASISAAMNHGLTFQSYFAQDGASGVLGVGPNAGGPGPSIATQALAAPYNQGLLINETGQHPYLQFGAPPTNLNPIALFSGSPIATLEIGTGLLGAIFPQYSVNAVIDSGGVEGTIPTGLNAVPGELISVFAPNGALLYSYIYDGTYFPTPSPYIMNTGALPFLEHPVYVSYSPSGVGTTTFYQ